MALDIYVYRKSVKAFTFHETVEGENWNADYEAQRVADEVSLIGDKILCVNPQTSSWLYDVESLIEVKAVRV